MVKIVKIYIYTIQLRKIYMQKMNSCSCSICCSCSFDVVPSLQMD